jgi:hypothetical protein
VQQGPAPQGSGPFLLSAISRVALPLLSFTAEDHAVNWFNLSFVGWVIVIIALALGAYMMHAPPVWIAIGALALLGIGIITSVSHAKPRI